MSMALVRGPGRSAGWWLLSAPLVAFAKETFVLFPRELNPAPSRCVLPD
jgi:hypothetical protein